MPLPEVLALVTNRLASVGGVMNVYNYKRLAVESHKFKQLFVDENARKLHTWFVSRESSHARDDGTQAYRRTHVMVLMGYYAVDDAAGSELAFNTIIEAVCEAFDPINLRTYENEVDWSKPLQVEGPRTVMFGSVLCHAVKLTHEVDEWPLS